MSKTIFFLLMATFVQGTTFAHNESDFYTPPTNPGVTRNLVSNYGANGNDDNDDSDQLQNAIDAISASPDGGTLIIPDGTFYITDIQLKSNVHIRVSKNAIIKPTPRTDSKNYKLFNYGGQKNKRIENVSIEGIGGYFTVDLREVTNMNAGVIGVGGVSNFMVDSILVLDKLTKFSAITFGLHEFNGGYISPENGLIKNVKCYGQHYGYGVIQTQAAKKVMFKNLWGEGGVTLRLETGLDKMNELQIGGVFDIVGQNLYCEYGNAALMISPHAMHNGIVDLDTVISKVCGFAARIGAGYVKPSQAELGLTPGTFEKATVKNVTATYGNLAQLKSKHFKYMPCVLRDSVEIDPNHISTVPIYIGPAIAPVVNETIGDEPGKYNAEVSNATKIGFEYLSKAILLSEDAISDEECKATSTNDPFKGITWNIFPNPFNHKITVSLDANHSFTQLEIMDIGGKRFYSKEISSINKIDIPAQELEMPKGIYLVRIDGPNTSVTQKMVRQ